MTLYHKKYEKKKAHTEVIHLSMGIAPEFPIPTAGTG